MEKGADLDVKDKHGWTALHYAAWQGKLKVVQYLIDNGADSDVTSNDGKTALHHVSKGRQSTDLVQYLVESGATIDVQDE